MLFRSLAVGNKMYYSPSSAPLDLAHCGRPRPYFHGLLSASDGGLVGVQAPDPFLHDLGFLQQVTLTHGSFTGLAESFLGLH